MAERCTHACKDWKHGPEGITGVSVGDDRPRSATRNGRVVAVSRRKCSHSTCLSLPINGTNVSLYSAIVSFDGKLKCRKGEYTKENKKKR